MKIYTIGTPNCVSASKLMKETLYEIQNENIAEKLGKDSLRLALLSDTHNVNPERIIKSLQQQADNAGLDFIAISGDFVVGHRPDSFTPVVQHYENVLPLISSCSNIAPTFVSLGNHEWMISDFDIELLEDAGARVLDNAWTTFTKASQGDDSSHSGTCPRGDARQQPSIVIGGLTSSLVTYYQNLRSHHMQQALEAHPSPIAQEAQEAQEAHLSSIAQQAQLPYKASRYQTAQNDPESQWLEEFEAQSGLKILMCHHPEYWALREPFLARRNIDLVLSGHAHGGQFRFLGHGVLSPGQGLFPKYTSGVHQGDYGSLVISKGLANTAYPIPRLFNPVEVVYFEINGD